jgi:hypothetical protein
LHGDGGHIVALSRQHVAAELPEILVELPWVSCWWRRSGIGAGCMYAFRAEKQEHCSAFRALTAVPRIVEIVSILMIYNVRYNIDISDVLYHADR